MELPKVYDPASVEPKWYEFWLEQDYFHADAAAPKTPFSIVIPPPNVTGSLHMGHALMVTVQDILIRWRRMQAYNALWLPGTDHAGIATQIMVERELWRTEKKTRHDIGREEFLRRVWTWKERHGGRIALQMRKLGASLDWKRDRFTMDEDYTRAVREAFVRLHEDGLIYRAKRLINWCTRCQTALSDLEVESQEEPGSLWHIAYPVVDSGERLVVATTRPETMLGDTAVAIHPEDERYRHLIGKMVRLPLSGREIPIIADGELVDPAFGTGVVKVTPGHDFRDFETGLRHDLPQLSIFDNAGRVIDPAPDRYRGLEVQAARKAVIADLETEGFLVETKPHAIPLGRCDRCTTVVEPLLSMQWFVKTKPLAEAAIAAVEQGKTRFVPEAWTKTYMHWMRNIKDWCISRQLWWGHRIPAWTCKGCGEIVVAHKAPTACSCGGSELAQDEDVLDTWFSSGLWPFATLGWPESTRDLKTFYPTSVMETGSDIIFFWVARMMMFGLHFMKKVPFRQVFLHAIVVDENGEKMSKTKGNVVDPLDVVLGATKDQLLDKARADGAPDAAVKNIAKNFPEGIPAAGADALRFTLAAMAAQGRNIRLSMARVEGYRHFANKIWNASRFVLMNLERFDADAFADKLAGDPGAIRFSLADRWILSRLQHTASEVDDALEAFRLNDAAQALYRFIWNDFCDWYIELSKPALQGEGRGSAQGTLGHVLETAMRLLHPFMPFLSEEIWQKLPKPAGLPASLMITLYPRADDRLVDDAAEKRMELLMETAVAVRNLRAEYGVPPSTAVDVLVRVPDDTTRQLMTDHGGIVERAARASMRIADEVPAGKLAAKAVVGGNVEVIVPLEGLIDVAAEKVRLEKEAKKAQKEIDFLTKKLENPSFVERAPQDVVDRERSRLAEETGRLQRLQAARQQLEG
ncbi:MAG: valine--tRNA ligase [Deltaproteobacteria bacterium]|nr:valine--tRNA ligase [Deltaproteobacteria bacterium]